MPCDLALASATSASDLVEPRTRAPANVEHCEVGELVTDGEDTPGARASRRAVLLREGPVPVAATRSAPLRVLVMREVPPGMLGDCPGSHGENCAVAKQPESARTTASARATAPRASTRMNSHSRQKTRHSSRITGPHFQLR